MQNCQIDRANECQSNNNICMVEHFSIYKGIKLRGIWQNDCSLKSEDLVWRSTVYSIRRFSERYDFGINVRIGNGLSVCMSICILLCVSHSDECVASRAASQNRNNSELHIYRNHSKYKSANKDAHSTQTHQSRTEHCPTPKPAHSKNEKSSSVNDENDLRKQQRVLATLSHTHTQPAI